VEASPLVSHRLRRAGHPADARRGREAVRGARDVTPRSRSLR
jgi:hypothetical protein